MTQEVEVFKMSDLVRLTGASKQTIHYYLKEGLLLPPVRTSKNMAYYDASTVDDIRFIKDLQENRYLPLAVIKDILTAKRKGHDLAEEDHLLFAQQLFNQVRETGADEQFDEASFLAKTGFSKEDLSQLIGVISSSTEAEKRQFDEFDIAIARAMKGLITLGLGLEDLKLYGDFLQCARMEAKLVHDRVIHRYADEQHKPLKEIQIGLEKVKILLTAKAYREFIVNHSHEERTGKGGS